MQEQALKLVKELTSHGFKAYIVGGFVRDFLLGIPSIDIDITTNATPKEVKTIFEDSCLPSDDYGVVTVMKNDIYFEITTFRKELGYTNHRKPSEIQYIDDLYQDLLRRDFTINTICMDENGEIIDFLGGKGDIEAKLIRTVGDARTKLEEDCLRILRAVRFSTVLGFQLSLELKEAIKETKHLLKDLSYYRKKQELDKIFSSPRAKEGISLLLELGLDKDLELSNLKEVQNTSNLIAIWSVLNVHSKYPFTNNEKEMMESIRKALSSSNLDPMTLYQYGLYANSVAGDIKGFDKKKITEAYQDLVIHSRGDLAVTTEDITGALDREAGPYLKEIYQDIERQVLYHKLANDKKKLLSYIILKYKNKVD